MFRLSGLFFIFISILCAVLLFETSQSVQSLEDDLKVITEKNQKEKDEIRVLATEWDYLNSPQRLESLISGQALQPITNFATGSEKIPEPEKFILPKHKPRLIKYKETE
jgi:hypothetical protein